MLLENRKESVEKGYTSFNERMAWKMWKMGMLRRKWMNMAGGGTKSWIVNSLVKDWTKHRGKMEFPKKSFNQLWREKNGNS